MKRVLIVLLLSFWANGCATGAKFLSDIEDAPKWFIDQIPAVESKGYPSVASTPQKPDDLPALESWDVKLQTLKAIGEQIDTDARDSANTSNQDTEQFLQSSLQRTDVDKFNEEEAAALAAKTKDE